MTKPAIYLKPVAPMAPREVRELSRTEAWSLEELAAEFPGWKARRRPKTAAKRGLRRRQPT